jgi:hypothetical protein
MNGALKWRSRFRVGANILPMVIFVLGFCNQNSVSSQDLPDVARLVAELKRFEKQYFGCRMEVEIQHSSKIFDGIWILRVAKDGRAITYEGDVRLKDEVFRGGHWASDNFSVGFSSFPDHSATSALLGDMRTAWITGALMGGVGYDGRFLSDLFNDSLDTTNVRKEEDLWVLESLIPQEMGGGYRIKFEEYAPGQFRVKSWDISKAKGQAILNNSARFIVGEIHPDARVGLTPYGKASLVRLLVTLDDFDSQQRPRLVREIEEIDSQQSSKQSISILSVKPSKGPSAGLVAFETFSIPDKIQVFAYGFGSNSIAKPMGQSYELQMGKLVQVANFASVVAAESPPPFRKPASRIGFYTILLSITALIFVFLIWKMRRGDQKGL